jgi:murein DD-endopeptidase MepM/ murein hydrolase activator NlpD
MVVFCSTLFKKSTRGISVLALTLMGLQIPWAPAEAAEAPEVNPYVYSTSENIVLKGIIAPTALIRGKRYMQLTQQEVAIPADTKFEVLDRVHDQSGLRLVNLAIETGETRDAKLTLWVLESELARTLSSEKQLAKNLDEIDATGAKFYYMGEYQVAGPTKLILPVRGARRTSPPGMRIHPILRYRKFHAGWDLAAPTGTPVWAVADGIVTSAGWGGGYGNLIIIQHGRLETRYAHLSRILVRTGQTVKTAQMIGRVGSTGLSTGPHLHFEKRSGGRVLTGPITSPY